MSKADRTIERMRGRPPLPGYRPDQRLPEQAVRVPRPYNGSKLPQGATVAPRSDGLLKKGGVNPNGMRSGNLPDALYGNTVPKMVKRGGNVKRIK